MKRYLILIIIFTFPLLAVAQTGTENYIRTKTHTTPTTTATEAPIINVTYYDGIGRPKQSVAVGAGGDKQDHVTHMPYDGFGRQAQQYLPYVDINTTTPNLDLRNSLSLPGLTNSVYYAKYNETQNGAGGNPYSETLYEANSPLNRVEEQAAPGLAWKGDPAVDTDHTIKFDYQTNKTGEVRRFYVGFVADNTEMTELKTSGYYVANRLYKTITKDENWTIADGKNRTTEEFKDKEGKIVLKRTYESGKKHDTYYVYDRFGNLTYVIPPLASESVVIQTPILLHEGINYPWTKLSSIDAQLEYDFDIRIKNFSNSEILNLPFLNEFGGQGGFSLSADENGKLAMSINITTSGAKPYRTGVIADLTDMGQFPNKELGRINGSGYEYIFFVNDNRVEVAGYGDVPSLVTTLTGNKPLEYSKNYPWTKICQGDPGVFVTYENDIQPLSNNQILNTYTPNYYEATGGVAVSLDEFDNLTISVNLTNTKGMELVSGVAFPLDIERRIDDRTLGVVDGVLRGSPYHYEFSVLDNNLHITGYGTFEVLNHFSIQASRPIYDISETTVDGLCYIYHYDKRNRVVEKHIPDNGWTHIVYDRLDRPVLTQDENLRLKQKWLFTKYEVMGRVAYSGMLGAPEDRLTMQQMFNDPNTIGNLWEMANKQNTFTNGGNEIYYNNTLYPTDGIDVFIVNYYDEYGFRHPSVTVPSIPVYDEQPTERTKGLVLGTDVRILDTDLWTKSLAGYDSKGRLIYNYLDNDYLHYKHITENDLDFTGNITESKNMHISDGQQPIGIIDSYSYDHMLRPIRHTQIANGQDERLIAWNKYDAFGQLEQKKVGDTYLASYNAPQTGLQTVDYKYNIRGWLKMINDGRNMGTDLFAFKINYNTTEISSSQPLYNGNISETLWTSLKDPTIIRSYRYDYDALNRLTDANYSGTSLGGFQENYFEGGITYDKNGNIKSLNRWGYTGNTCAQIDQLTYSYMPYSNKLESVSDNFGSEGFNNGTTGTGIDYEYDLNGNLKKDLNKQIGTVTADETTYNHLNLPVVITKDYAHKLEFVYDATGKKLQKKYTNGINNQTVTQYYDDGFIYEKVNGAPYALQFFSHEEGYAKWDASQFSYIYHYKDHLGNVRMSYTDIDDNGSVGVNDILEHDNYYAFGLKHEGYNNQVLPNGNELARFLKYNGAELNEELNLGIYSMDIRNYDPSIGRWISIDPITHHNMSPYTAFDNNPIFWADPSGADSEESPLFEKDMYGSDRFDSNGSYIAPHNRNKNSNEGPIQDFFERVSNKLSVNEYLTNKEFNKKYDQTIEVLIWEKEGDKDVGHTAIRINGIVYGYYPTDMDGNGRYDMSDLQNSNGEMHIDNSAEFKANYLNQKITSYSIKVTGTQKQQLVKNLNSIAGNPGKYKLLGNQCTSMALQAMADSDIRLRTGSGIFISESFRSGLIMSPNQLKNNLESRKNNDIVRNAKTFTVQ